MRYQNSNLKGVTDIEFPFYDSPDTATIICCHILERQAPILYVSHDEDDGMWQFLCGETHETDEAKLYSRAIKFAKSRCIAPIRYAIIRAYLMGGKSYGKY